MYPSYRLISLFKGGLEEMDTCVCKSESLHCSPEITAALLINYTQIQNKKFKKKLYWKHHF